MDQLIAAMGAFASILGLGAGTISQGIMVKQELSPPAQQQVVRQCPSDTDPMMATQNGQPVMICIPRVSQR